MGNDLPSRFEGKHEWKKLYDSKLWKDLRRVHLGKHPLCAWCLKQGRTRQANTVHHKLPHRGDMGLFNDPNNLESLCPSCHSGDAQQQEVRGYSATVGDDGWPVDPKHPQNKR